MLFTSGVALAPLGGSMDFKNYNIVDGFNFIAPAYDIANDAMTFGMHRLWRSALCGATAKTCPKGAQVLDVATGTGDVVLGLLKLRPDLRITGIDPSEGMLEVAREKFAKQTKVNTSGVQLLAGDARKMPFESETFDAVTISWGIRNVRPHSEGLQEILRVLKPGGHLFILESGRPEFKIVELLYRYYAKILPHIGGRISGFLPAYKYYAQSVDLFPCGKAFVAELFECGYMGAKYTTLGGSIVYLYSAQKSQK
jgi:demethylmenaquinone methyltransferase / 2-methoxy-6-polyprenyl-1,4-benzoquinol methylase